MGEKKERCRSQPGEPKVPEPERYCEGAQNVCLGANAKITPKGKCNHPDRREVRREYLDGLPIPEWAWPHCVFCRSGKCAYAGECEHREEEDGDAAD